MYTKNVSFLLHPGRKILPALFEGYALENSFIIINLHLNLKV